jgi:NhaA family Na+:H+ antiporter
VTNLTFRTRAAAVFRSERVSASAMLGAAALALILANTPLGPALLELRSTPLAVPFTGLQLSVGHWVTDGLLAVFFFVVAVELRHEFTRGELASVRKAAAPTIAALGGVVTPALVYLAFTAGSGLERGWPIPTATDIAFSLGVLALFGRGLPTHVRAFLLALAILDDLVGILIIAVGFASDVRPWLLALAAVAVVAFALLSRALRTVRGMPQVAVIALMLVLAVATWWLVHESGVHATIAGVALGAAMSPGPARVTASTLEPWTNGAVLPLFAFTAALVPIPAVPLTQLSPAFWGIAVGLVAGKLVGITAGGWLASRLLRHPTSHHLPFFDLVAVAALGGIGFTVSLLLNELALGADRGIADQGTLGVLAGSAAAMVIAAVVVSVRAAHYRRRLAQRAREMR